MKPLLNILLALTVAVSPALADAKVKAGPRKGRVLEMQGKNAEFLVAEDRTISIAFYDAAMKPQAPTTEVAAATAEAPARKARLEFEKKGNLLVSKTPLPAGELYTVVVQLKATADAKSRNFRIPLNLSLCKPCGNAEYACTCDE